MFYREVFESLSRNAVRYLVVGGVAVNIHGVPRMTYDLDLMIALDEKNIKKFWSAMTDLGFSPRVPFRLEDFVNEDQRKFFKKTKNMLVLSFFKGRKQFDVVDVFIENPFDFETCYEKREIHSIGAINDITVISKEYLIQLKELASRAQDKSDIAMLQQIEKK